jgi:hypothetical protein
MTLEEFKHTLKDVKPPQGFTEPLKALWYDAKNDWETSHNVAQEIHNNDGSWIHAYLHRKEGDAGNASYWYHRAGKPVCKLSLDQEWEQLVKAFLK